MASQQRLVVRLLKTRIRGAESSFAVSADCPASAVAILSQMTQRLPKLIRHLESILFRAALVALCLGSQAERQRIQVASNFARSDLGFRD